MKRMLVCLLFVVGCSPSLDVGDGLVVSCSKDADCPTGETCLNGTRCVTAALIDTNGAEPLLPSIGRTFRTSDTIVFTWVPVHAAASYTVRVASDAAMTTLVAGTPVSTTDPTITLGPLAEGTYYWQVLADVTEQTSTAPSVFGVVSDTLYVACSAGADCSAAASPEAGTIAAPYRSIGRAQTVASGLGVHVLKVATGSYPEAFDLVAGFDVSGGWDATFTAQNSRSQVSADEVVVDALDIEVPTRLDGFELIASAGTTAMRIVLATDALVLSNCKLSSPVAAAPLLTIDGVVSSPAPPGPTFDHVDFAATAAADAHAVGLSARHGTTFTATNVTITMSGGQSVTGVDLETASVTMRDVTMTFSDTASATAVSTRTDATIESAGFPIAYAKSDFEKLDVTIDALDFGTGVNAFGQQALIVDQSTFRIRAPSLALGAKIGSDFAAHITSSIFELVGDDVIGIDFENCYGGLVAHNTLVLVETAKAYGVELDLSYPRIINNVFVAAGSALHAGIYDATNVPPIAILNNVYEGFADTNVLGPGCAYRIKSTSCATVNDAHSSATYVPTVGGNVAIALNDSTALGGVAGTDGVPATEDDVLKPTAASTALVGKGYNTTQADPGSGVFACGYASTTATFGDPTRLNVDSTLTADTPSCGGSMADRDNVSRPVPPTVGAYEP